MLLERSTCSCQPLLLWFTRRGFRNVTKFEPLPIKALDEPGKLAEGISMVGFRWVYDKGAVIPGLRLGQERRERQSADGLI